MAVCALQLKESHYYPMCSELYVQIMRMCTTVRLNGARVSDTKDHVQVRCRDEFSFIISKILYYSYAIFEEFRGGAGRHCRDCISKNAVTDRDTDESVIISLCDSDICQFWFALVFTRLAIPGLLISRWLILVGKWTTSRSFPLTG